jgi:uncharacterized LabA/DUF88 family protein
MTLREVTRQQVASWSRFPHGMTGTKVMVFVDGENLAARYGALLKDLKDRSSPSHVIYEPMVFAWTPVLMEIGDPPIPVIRHHYYTSVEGDEVRRNEIHDKLAALGIEAPRVFYKRKSHPSKRVDISLSVDMLSHAHRKNYDLAVLVAGDEDYVPLVQAVEAEGCRVALWFFEGKENSQCGLSLALKRQADHFFNLYRTFFEEED